MQAVLARGLVVAEVYDIMARVQRLLVRAQAAPVRELAASVSTARSPLQRPSGVGPWAPAPVRRFSLGGRPSAAHAATAPAAARILKP